jgi:hypothetical protein
MLQLLGVILVVGVLLWLVQYFLTPYIDALVLRIFYVVVIILLILYILNAFGLLPLANLPVPKVR